MKIFIVGNVLKDVYLNLDTRSKDFETDKRNVKWLNLSFDASKHCFYNRHSSLGGAAVTLEVMKKMGLNAEISDSALNFSDEQPAQNVEPDFYRYILVSDDGVAYFAPTNTRESEFKPSEDKIDYIYVDRSACLTQETVGKINQYLDEHKGVELVVYLKAEVNPYASELAKRADLVFTETKNEEPADNEIFISESEVSYQDIVEPIAIERVDKMTHLSAYSIIAGTVLGGFVLGNTVEDSFKLARANVENSTIDSVLGIEELKELIDKPEEDSLELIAASLMAPKKGILAADESGGSIKKKFAELEIEDTFENRHDYRNIFFTTPDLEKYVNGVILFDETARDTADNGMTNVDYLISRRIIPGIKVDQGLEKFEGSEETWTKGLDDLPERLHEYQEMGLKFAKWRAAFNLTLNEDGSVATPTEKAILTNCKILAEYARDCQESKIVPIVEPEVVYDGYYPIEKNAEVTGKILDCLFEELKNFEVNLSGCILKVNMVLAGKQFETQSTSEEVGRFTADTLKSHVPEGLAGVVFLSGGQTVEQATDNLAEVIKNGPFPWTVTFSFARALQDPALYAWHGDINNADEAREAFKQRLIANTEVL